MWVCVCVQSEDMGPIVQQRNVNKSMSSIDGETSCTMKRTLWVIKCVWYLFPGIKPYSTHSICKCIYVIVSIFLKERFTSHLILKGTSHFTTSQASVKRLSV